MNTEDFIINFQEGKSKVRIRVLSSENYIKEVNHLKETALLIKECKRFCAFISEGERITLFDAPWIEKDRESILCELNDVWGGKTNDIFSMLFEVVSAIQK